MTASHSSSSIWMARLSARTPALFTSASTGPSCSVAAADRASGGPAATSPPTAPAGAPAAGGAPARPLARRHGRLRARLVGAVVDRHEPAVGGERPGDRRADALG